MDLAAHLPMVRGIVRRMHMTGMVPVWMETDDLVSVGTIALFDAERRYRPDRGATFRTFATIRVKGALLDYLRREAPNSRWRWAAVKRGEVTGFLNVQLAHLEDAAHLAVVTPEAQWTLRILANEVLAALSVRDRYVLVEYFYGGRDERGIARAMGISQPRLSQLKARALRRARQVLEQEPKT